MAGGPSGRPYRGLGTWRLRETHSWQKSPAASTRLHGAVRFTRCGACRAFTPVTAEACTEGLRKLSTGTRRVDAAHLHLMREKKNDKKVLLETCRSASVL